MKKTRKIICLSIIILSFGLFSSVIAQQQKKIIETFWKNINGKLIKDSILPLYPDSSIEIININGDKIEKMEFKNGKISLTKYFYNNKNKILKEEGFNKNGELSSFKSYSYNSVDSLSETKSYFIYKNRVTNKIDTSLTTIKYVYNSNNRRIEDRFFHNKDTIFTGFNKYHYQNDSLIKKEEWSTNGKLYNTWNYTTMYYGKNKSIIYEWIGNNENLREKYITDYDEKDRIIKAINLIKNYVIIHDWDEINNICSKQRTYSQDGVQLSEYRTKVVTMNTDNK